MELFLWYLLGFAITLLLSAHLEINDESTNISLTECIGISIMLFIGWWVFIWMILFYEDGGYGKEIKTFLFKKR